MRLLFYEEWAECGLLRGIQPDCHRTTHNSCPGKDQGSSGGRLVASLLWQLCSLAHKASSGGFAIVTSKGNSVVTVIGSWGLLISCSQKDTEGKDLSLLSSSSYSYFSASFRCKILAFTKAYILSENGNIQMRETEWATDQSSPWKWHANSHFHVCQPSFLPVCLPPLQQTISEHLRFHWALC